MSAPVVDSVRADGWRVCVHADDSFTLVGEGQRWDADQVALLLALGGDLPPKVTALVQLLLVWRAHAAGVPASRVMLLARIDSTRRAQMAGEAAGKGPLMPLFVRDPEELVRQATAVALPAGTGAHQWFTILAKDPAALVRACIAINPHTPAAVRAALMDDPEDSVAVAARRNPSPERIKLSKAQKRRQESAGFAVRGGTPLRAVELTWALLATSSDMQTRLSVAGRDDAPHATLDYLAKEDHASLGTVLATRERIKNRGWV